MGHICCFQRCDAISLSFPHPVAVSVWELIEILTNVNIICLPSPCWPERQIQALDGALSLVWSVDFTRQSRGLPLSRERLSRTAATHSKRKPVLLWCLKACIIFAFLSLSPGHHSLSYVFHPGLLLSAHQLQGLLLPSFVLLGLFYRDLKGNLSKRAAI